jgi:predicted ABC-type ATPase
LISRLRSEGYRVNVFFLWLPNVELALDRVRDRVRSGGHSVPEEVVRRRFARGIKNLFRIYIPLIDSWLIFDNAGESPRRVAFGVGQRLNVFDSVTYGRITQEAGAK